MARPKPNPAEVLPHIISEAVSLIQSHGFESMTMKRLAESSAMSVGKLYHFFPSKDDLFLTLEIHYFDGLYNHIIQAMELENGRNAGPRETFRAMLDAYYVYAVEHFELYKLVTSPPKVFAHYLGTKTEDLAKKELVSAMRAIALFRQQFEAALCEKASGEVVAPIDSLFILFVNSLHGLILMSQSTAWPYLAMDSNAENEGQWAEAIPSSATPLDIKLQLDLIVEKLL